LSDGRVRTGFAECRFAVGRQAAKPIDLIGFRWDAGTLLPSSLYFLKRFWLDTPEADRADPQPVSLWAAAPDVSAPIAHALQQMLNALPGMAIYGMLAAAYSLVYGLSGRINLAFGEMAAIGGAASITGLAFISDPGMGSLVLVAVLSGVWVAALHGIAIARWIFMPLRRTTGQQGLVATIGLALVLNEYLRLAQGPTPRWITPLRSTPFGLARADQFLVTVTPIDMAVAGAFVLVAWVVLGMMARSQFGRNWRALSDDPKAAALLGVSSARMFTLTFALASALAGASGAATVLVYGSFGASFGATLGLKSLLAAILGGIGSVPGAFIGGIAISLMEAGWSAFFPIEYRDLALFVLLAGALIARPGGFLGFRDLAPRRV
jgi:branched-chain amino acid transport system permease protein